MVSYLINNIASGKMLDVPNHSTENGVRIDQWTDNGGANQHWELVDAGNGLVKIRNVESKKVLQLRDSKPVNGGVVEQSDDTGLPKQHFKISDGGRGMVKIFSALPSNQVLDIPGGNPADGVGLQVWNDVDVASEHWALIMTDVKIVNTASNKVMDLPGFNTADGTVIGQWEDTGGVNQRWRLYPIDTGLYLIGNMASGKFLDVGPVVGTVDGPQVVQQPMRPGAMTQRWSLVTDATSGVKQIVNAAVKQPMIVSGLSTNNGAPICLLGKPGPITAWNFV